MKKITILFLLSLTLVFSIHAQNQDGVEVEPNEKIKAAFNKKYIGEKLLFGWRKVADLYIVTFQHKATYKYCSYKANGIWHEAGEAIDKDKVPDGIYEVLPEMDMTAFLVESFAVNTYDDVDGFMLLYETELDRIELIISNEGRVIRKNKYKIPEKKEEEEEEKDGNAVEWDDGK